MADIQGNRDEDKTSREGVVNAGMFADEQTNLSPKQAYCKDHQILIPETESV